MSEEEKKLSEYLDLQSLYDHCYNPSYLDPMIYVEKTKKYETNQAGFIQLSKNILLNHLKQSYNFYLESSPMVWRLVVPTEIMHSYLWIDMYMPNRIDDIDYAMKDTKLFKKVDSTVRNMQDNETLVLIFYSPAAYFYLSLILTIALLFISKNYSWLLFLFNAINVGIISLSIPVQDTRYLLNSHGLVLILAIYLIDEAIKRKNNC